MFKDSGIQGRVGLPLRCRRQRSTPQTAGSWEFDLFSKRTQKDIALFDYIWLKICSLPLDAIHLKVKPSIIMLIKHAKLIMLIIVNADNLLKSKAKNKD